MEIALWIVGYLAVGLASAFVSGALRRDISEIPLMLIWPVGIPLVTMVELFEAGERWESERRWKADERRSKPPAYR
jgi:hypothetical protein